MEAKYSIAGPDEQVDEDIMEQQVQALLFLFLFFLLLAVEGEEVQPAAGPNEEEDDCIEEGLEEQGKDRHGSHLANQ